MSRTPPPPPLAELAAWLTSVGFDLDQEMESPGFGDRAIVYASSELLVRFVSDRGQWFLEVSGVRSRDWFDCDTWRACLDASEATLDPSPLADQAAFLLTNLDRIAAALREDPRRLGECLRATRSRRAMRRLDPSGGASN
jgi:hypothetical protein